ncbi:MAG: NUDIX domain-containing protein [Planctomycetia bacterium]|nr:NUDIX domain-containing protein [Planctomycetia bacterium]
MTIPYTKREWDRLYGPDTPLPDLASLFKDDPGPIVRYGVVAAVAHPNDEYLPDHQRRYLVIRRAESVIAPGALCFPGGGIEQGESADQAVIREFREEVGGTVTVTQKIWSNTTPWRVHLDWFLGRLVTHPDSLSIDPREVAELLWITLDELANSPDTLLSNLPFLKLYANRSLRNGQT